MNKCYFKTDISDCANIINYAINGCNYDKESENTTCDIIMSKENKKVSAHMVDLNISKDPNKDEII